MDCQVFSGISPEKSHTIFQGGMLMSYRIRYGPSGVRRAEENHGRMLRWQICAAGLVIIWGIGFVFPEAGAILRELLCREPMTAGEQAVAAFAQALRLGKGWYDGLAVWCRTILFGPV